MTEQPASASGDSIPPPSEPAPPTADISQPAAGPNQPPGPVQPERPVPPGDQFEPGAAPPGGQVSYQPMSPADERLWATLAHGLALVAFFFLFGLSMLGPLIVYVIYANRSQFVRGHAVEALNFNISMLIAWLALFVVGLILTISIIGIVFLIFLIPLAFLLWIYWLVYTIVAAIQANQGRAFRYPLSIRFVT